MQIYKYIILGAGPSGLSFAHTLINQGILREQILVIEKESVAGGLCRSDIVDGAPLDIGGGHFLDIRRKNVLEFLFQFMPKHEWNTFKRISKIRLHEKEIDYPLETNLWQCSEQYQSDCINAIKQAGCITGEAIPESFSDWIIWKFGKRLADDYMLPYNRKIWSMDLNSLGTYWLHKLPNVSYEQSLQSIQDKAPFGEIPAHGTFLYPKNHGYGEVWQRMGQALKDSLITNCPVESLDLSTLTINGQWRGENIINTIPWLLWNNFCHIPKSIAEQINHLRKISIDVDYQPISLDSPSHWIYEPNENISHHRELLRSNFCTNARGHWTETNSERSKYHKGFRHRNEFAYPINSIHKLKHIHKIQEWALSLGIVGIGRWGKWEHMNSDVAVDEAISTATHFLNNGSWL